MANVLIALGGNIGDVGANFVRAIGLICARTNGTLLARSSDYETPPWGEERQPPFINACIELETTIEPHTLLATLHGIEAEFGRDRSSERRWGPRTLDLDLLAYDDLLINDRDLTLPHPRLFERAFVLLPLAEIAPDRVIGGRTAANALRNLSSAGIKRLPHMA
jgi:2-amino-4-hydroxy-6-hydroxymethyldihydropteridine diphosphokinase